MILLLVCQALMASSALPLPAGQAHFKTVGPMAREVYSGEAVGRDTMANLVEGDLGDKPTPFTLALSGYTSAPEAERYAQILKAKGQNGLFEAMSTENLGHFRLNGDPERTIIFAQESQDETSRTIRVLCQRWLNTFIIGEEDRAAEFPFAYIQLTVDKRCNTGDGTMYTAANVKFSGASGIIVGVARYDARVVFPTNRAVKSIGVEDYANNRDWLQYVRLNGAALTQAQR